MNVSTNRQPRFAPQSKASMPSQRVSLGIGLAILLIISAASIGLDVKSRYDAASVDHTHVVLQKIADLRLLLRRAESASRGFALTADPNLVKEYRASSEAVSPAFADLIETTRDNPGQTRLLQEARAMADRRLAVTNDLIRLKVAGDTAGIEALTARAEGRAVMETLSANLDNAIAEEKRLLAIRYTDSGTTRGLLLAIDLAGIALILVLATVLTRKSSRSSRAL